MTNVVPPGWCTFRLREVLREEAPLCYGVVQPGELDPAGVPLIRVCDIEDGHIRTNRLRSVSRKIDAEYRRSRVRAGDVVVTIVGTIGRSAIVPPELTGANIARAVARLSVAEFVDPSWLLIWLQHPSMQWFLNNQAREVARKTLNLSTLADMKMPVAPVSEQRRILNKLNSLRGRSRRARTQLDTIPSLIEKLKRSLLAAAFRGSLTSEWRGRHSDIESASKLLKCVSRDPAVPLRRGVPEDNTPTPAFGGPSTWTIASVARLLRQGAFQDVKDGNHGANHPTRGDFRKYGIPFITAAQVTDFRIDYEGAPKLDADLAENLYVGHAQPGDVILTHKGSVGRSAVASESCVLTPQTTYYRINTKVLAPQYLMYYFASPQFHSQLAEVKNQTTRDFVPIAEQYKLNIIVPPLSEQHAIVHRLNTAFRQIDEINELAISSVAKLDHVERSILAKAFRGEIMPQDPDDEPASLLLERIRSGRNGEVLNSKRHHRKGEQRFKKPTKARH